MRRDEQSKFFGTTTARQTYPLEPAQLVVAIDDQQRAAFAVVCRCSRNLLSLRFVGEHCLLPHARRPNCASSVLFLRDILTRIASSGTRRADNERLSFAAGSAERRFERFQEGRLTAAVRANDRALPILRREFLDELLGALSISKAVGERPRSCPARGEGIVVPGGR